MGTLQSNACNWTVIQLLFVHPVSKDIRKTLTKCLPGFFRLGEMDKRGLNPWMQLQGRWGMPGLACREGLKG